MKLLLPLIAVILLTACEPRASNFEIYCPPLKEYRAEFNQELATEVQSLPTDADAIPVALSDYVALRDDVRACHKARDK